MADYVPILIALTSVLIRLLFCIDSRFIGVEAVGCPSPATCFSAPQKDTESVLNVTFLDIPEKAYDEQLMNDAVDVLNKHLSRKVATDMLEQNIAEAKSLLCNGRKLRKLCSKLSKGHLGSKESRTRDRVFKETMRDLLTHLVGLESAKGTGYQCFIYDTRNLKEINKMAKDPIRRLDGNQSDQSSRIDNLIFKAASLRANTCLPKYKDQLARMSLLKEPAVVVMMSYWDRVWEYRMRKVDFGRGKQIDDISRLYPRETLEFVQSMPNEVDSDESLAASSVLEVEPGSSPEGSLSPNMRTYNYERYVKRPCETYVNAVSGVLESVDFDLQLRAFVPEEVVEMVENDCILNRHRAYLCMCEKANQKVMTFGDYLKSPEF